MWLFCDYFVRVGTADGTLTVSLMNRSAFQISLPNLRSRWKWSAAKAGFFWACSFTLCVWFVSKTHKSVVHLRGHELFTTVCCTACSIRWMYFPYERMMQFCRISCTQWTKIKHKVLCPHTHTHKHLMCEHMLALYLCVVFLWNNLLLCSNCNFTLDMNEP